MTDLVHVASVESLGDHRLRLTFEDGSEGELDLSGWSWHGVFEPLEDPAYFGNVRLDEEAPGRLSGRMAPTWPRRRRMLGSPEA